MSEFFIPIAKADLLKLSAENAYVVNDVISVRNLRNNLPKCKRALTSSGYSYILSEFDTLFSVLHEWDKLDSNTKEEAWHIVLKGCEICARELGSVLETFDSCRSTYDQDDMKRHRSVIKMHTYLLCQFVDMFENELNVNAKSVISGNTGRGKGGKGNRRAGDREPADVNLSMNWLAECESAINIIDQMFRLKLDKLWEPPIVESEFINLSANCCYKLLENRDMASNQNIRMAIISLLANLVRRHRHGFTCAVKLAQLLQCYPHMVNCLLAIVKSFTEDEKINDTVRDLLKEICSYDGAHLERDSQASQNFSNFLIEVARLYPSLAQSILPLLRSRLDDEPYQMRNCVLSIIGEILPMFAKREQLDQNERVQRDRLMDLLQEHIHDVNGYVRAKALHIWHNIVALGGLPVSRQSKLAALLVGNLGAMMDVSASARKNACRTLTAMILQCPAAKLTANELQQVVNKEKKRLERLEEILARVNTIDENDGVTPSDLTEQLTALTDDGDGVGNDDGEAKGKNKSKIQKKTKKKGGSNNKKHKKNKKSKLTGLSDSDDESPTRRTKSSSSRRRSNIADDDEGGA
ncbi:unnamed protein product [Trichobilharzia szidati]|nr:unnamed protein product [Trichobilharzia szidati]